MPVWLCGNTWELFLEKSKQKPEFGHRCDTT